MIKTSAGVFFYSSNTNRYLYLLRSDSKSQTWSIPGGGMEPGETLLEGIARECTEEMGFFNNDWKLIPIQKFVNNTFVYHTFYCAVEEEFLPILNEEHCGYAWVELNQYPKPMHPGLWSTVNFDAVREKTSVMERS